MQLVSAQETRRILDRIFVYQVRPAVNAASGEKFTVGRVQSPAMRLVVERENAIRNFKSTTHFGVELTFDAVEHITDEWKAAWNTINPAIVEISSRTIKFSDFRLYEITG